jgi:hypothetical protein
MRELLKVADLIVDFVFWVDVVTKEQAANIIIHNLARLGEVTQHFVDALLKVVLALLFDDVEKRHSAHIHIHSLQHETHRKPYYIQT